MLPTHSLHGRAAAHGASWAVPHAHHGGPASWGHARSSGGKARWLRRGTQLAALALILVPVWLVVSKVSRSYHDGALAAHARGSGRARGHSGRRMMDEVRGQGGRAGRLWQIEGVGEVSKLLAATHVHMST